MELILLAACATVVLLGIELADFIARERTLRPAAIASAYNVLAHAVREPAVAVVDTTSATTADDLDRAA